MPSPSTVEVPSVVLGWVLAAGAWIMVLGAYRRWSRDAEHRAERRYDAYISASSIWLPLLQTAGGTAFAVVATVVLTVVAGPLTGLPFLVATAAGLAGTWCWIRILRTAAPMPDMLDDPDPEATAG